MKRNTDKPLLNSSMVFTMLLVSSYSVQTATGAEIQTTGTPGTPSATTTINGKQLPPLDPKFGGVIKENAAQDGGLEPTGRPKN